VIRRSDDPGCAQANDREQNHASGDPPGVLWRAAGMRGPAPSETERAADSEGPAALNPVPQDGQKPILFSTIAPHLLQIMAR